MLFLVCKKRNTFSHISFTCNSLMVSDAHRLNLVFNYIHVSCIIPMLTRWMSLLLVKVTIEVFTLLSLEVLIMLFEVKILLFITEIYLKKKKKSGKRVEKQHQ